VTLLTQIIEQAQAQSALELVAVLAAIAYLGLAIRQNIACWFFAALSTAIYIGLFIEARLYMESLLNAFYLAMAAYGWYVWRSSRGAGEDRPVATWPPKRHLSAMLVIVVLSVASGYILSMKSNAAFPYIDSLTTWSAIWATFLVAQKVLENWWYWLVIDIASVLIYWSRDLQLTALLFVVYVVMIPFGIISWSRSMREGLTCQ
jgi:nicotinamide mononucleotide transporter